MRAVAICAAAVCVFWIAPPVASAQPPPVAVLELAGVGFDGRVKPGMWTPVWVDVTAAAADVDGVVVVEAPAPGGQPLVRFGTPVRAAFGAKVRVFIPAVFFDARQPGTVHLEVGDRRLASLPVPRLRTAEEIVAVLSSEPLGVEAAAAKTGRIDVVYVTADALPRVWQAYESVRLLVVRTLDERRLDDDQRAALRHWLWSGGRILIMPAGDDVRHLDGPTFGPMRSGELRGQSGRGQFIQWTRDAADPALHGDPGQARQWDRALTTAPRPPVPSIEPAVPVGRAVPLRTHLVIGALVLVYVLAIRATSRRLASLRLLPLVAVVTLAAAAAAGSAGVAAIARRDASGVVSAVAIEVLPGTGHGVLYLAGRTVSSHSGPFAMSASRQMLVRPGSPAPVTLMFGQRTQVFGRGTGVQVVGSAVVPVAISGSYGVRGGGTVVSLVNRSGHPLGGAWVYAAGRVQRVPSVGESAEIVLDEQRWEPPDRVPRTDENHALLVWAFARLGSDAILKETPAWLVGWWRDPALMLTWDGRPEAPLQLVLVPLAARR